MIDAATQAAEDRANQAEAQRLCAPFDNAIATFFSGRAWCFTYTLKHLLNGTGLSEEEARPVLKEMVKAGALRTYISRGNGRGSSYNGKRVWEINFQ